MRVLFATHAFPRFPGDGAGSFILRLAHALRDEGVDVRVVAPSAPGLAPRESIDGIDVVRYRYAPSSMETLAYTGRMADAMRSPGGLVALTSLVHAASRAISSEARAWNADLVHAHWWFPAGLSASIARVPFVVTSHGTDVRLLPRGAATGARGVLARRVLRSARGVSAVSSWLADRLRTVGGVPVRVAPMPANTELFQPEPDRSRGENELLFVGRLTEQKGARIAIEALAHLDARVRLTMIGDGPDADKLRTLAETLRVADRIAWRPSVTQEELAEAYRSATVVMAPYTDEGFGLVAAEALLCETPVVAFDSGGLRDIVRDGETGWATPPGDAMALAAACREALARLGERSRRAIAGRALALELCDPRHVARAYASLYTAAVSAHAR